MTTYEENGEIHIIADEGMCIMRKDENVPFFEVWLARDDSVEDWIEAEYVVQEIEEK